MAESMQGLHLSLIHIYIASCEVNPVYFCLIFSVGFIFLKFFRSVQYNVCLLYTSLLFEDDHVYIVSGNRNVRLQELKKDLGGPKEGGLDRIRCV